MVALGVWSSRGGEVYAARLRVLLAFALSEPGGVVCSYRGVDVSHECCNEIDQDLVVSDRSPSVGLGAHPCVKAHFVPLSVVRVARASDVFGGTVGYKTLLSAHSLQLAQDSSFWGGQADALGGRIGRRPGIVYKAVQISDMLEAQDICDRPWGSIPRFALG